MSPSHLAGSDSKHAAPVLPDQVSTSEFHLHIGEAYEKNGQLGKAETEYVIAASGGTHEVQTQALANLTRILQLTTNHNLQIARAYENNEQWSQAEVYFLKAADSAQNQVDRQAALDGIERIRTKSVSVLDPALEKTEWLPKTGTLLLRLVAPIILILAAVRFFTALRTISKSTKIWPFEGDERLSRLIQSAFPAIRAKAFSVFGHFNAIKLPQTVSTVFPFVPLHLPGRTGVKSQTSMPSLRGPIEKTSDY